MIRQYIGLLGQGKTLMMVKDAWEYVLGHGKNYNIVSNQPIMVRNWRGKDVVNIEPTTGQALIDSFFHDINTLYLIDEAQLVFPAYKLTAITEDLQARWAYFRKYGCALLYTSQGYNHSHKRLRDLTNEVCQVKKKIRWHPIRHIASYYDPDFFAESKRSLNEEQNNEYLLYRKYVWWFQLGTVYKAYDTLWVSTTTISGDGIHIQLKQPKDIGVKPSLYQRI